MPRRVMFKERVPQGLGADECWPWIGGTDSEGYGQYYTGQHNGQRTRPASREMWERTNGIPIPDGMEVMHKCDTPACVNPAHLTIGTHAENMRDAKAKGRMWCPKGVRNEARLDEMVMLRRNGHTLASIGSRFGISFTAVYKMLKRHRPELVTPMKRAQ